MSTKKVSNLILQLSIQLLQAIVSVVSGSHMHCLAVSDRVRSKERMVALCFVRQKDLLLWCFQEASHQKNPLLFCRSARCPRKLGMSEEAVGWGSALPAASVHHFWSNVSGIQPVRLWSISPQLPNNKFFIIKPFLFIFLMRDRKG